MVFSTLIVESLKENATANRDGTLTVNYNLPCELTMSGQSEPCCTTAFEKLFAMSSKTRIAFQKLVEKREGVLDQSSAEVEDKSCRGEARRHAALLWMKETFHLLCDILPTSDNTDKDYHLPKCVSKTSMFEEYNNAFTLKEVKYGPEFKPYKNSYFYKLWKDNFPYVTVPTVQAFTMCEICAQLHDRLVVAAKSNDREMMRTLKRLRRIHLDHIAEERMEYRQHQELARESPDKFVSIVLDGMDQAKLRGPHFAGGGLPKGTCKTSLVQ